MTTTAATPSPATDAYRPIHFQTDECLQPTPYRFTADQVFKMADAEVFHPDAILELIEGELISFAPPSARRGSIRSILARKLHNDISVSQSIVHICGSVKIDEYTLAVPDFALLKPRADDYQYKLPTPEDVLHIIQISHASLHFDRTRKLALYADAEIPTYWILNVAEDPNAIEAHTDPEGDEYTTHNIYRPGDTITLEAFPGITINASDILLPTNQR